MICLLIPFLGAGYRDGKTSEDLLRTGTVRQLIDVARNNRTTALNVLDLALGDSHYVGVPPSFDDMASEEYATNRIPRKGWEAFDNNKLPIQYRNEVIWGSIANKNAISWPHLDDEGFATATCTLVGGKVWAFIKPKSDPRLATIFAFDEIDPFALDDKLIDVEIVYLPPKCVLYVINAIFCFLLLLNVYCLSRYQRPCTLHYVLTPDHTAVEGRHFYCSETIVESCCGMVHSFILGNTITNAQHDKTKPLAFRLMALWFQHYLVKRELSCVLIICMLIYNLQVCRRKSIFPICPSLKILSRSWL